MQSQSFSLLTFDSLSHPGGIVPEGGGSARCDSKYIPDTSRYISAESRPCHSKSLTNGEIDICTQVFGAGKCDNNGGTDAKSQESSHSCAGMSVRHGRMHKIDSIGYRTGLSDQTKSIEVCESCLNCSDTDGLEGRTLEDSQETILDPRQEIIAFDTICYEANLLAEAKRLREKNQGASSPQAIWIGAELLRLAMNGARPA